MKESASVDRDIDRYSRNKEIVDAVANSLGFETLWVWQPVPDYQYDLRYHAICHDERALCFDASARFEYGYPRMRELAEKGKFGRNFLWLADMQKDRRENLYVDSVHYNAAFSRDIAALISQAIQPMIMPRTPTGQPSR